MGTLTIDVVGFRRLRAAWLAANLDAETRALCNRNSIPIPEASEVTDDTPWGNFGWHLAHSVTDKRLEIFLDLFPEYRGKGELLKTYLESYDLSILPLNLLQLESVQKFLPSIGFRPAPDPYGVQREHSVVLRKERGKQWYLATHKPGYASFLPILGSSAKRIFCPIGCKNCYRGPQTRFDEPLHSIHADESRDEVSIPEPEQQMQWLVEEWNTRPEFAGVYDILLSGGEPMMLPNTTWAQILAHLARAKYLHSFRICTGALFLGLPFRFDDEFIKLLVDFRNTAGVQIKFSVHLSHPEHVTPEAVYFARRLVHAGIELLPQCPLEAGVNFWMDNLGRTEATLRRLGRLLAFVVGTRGYKWIIDMQGSVALLPAIEIWRRLHDCHQGESDITRPTSFDFFLPSPHGNTNLSYHTLFAIKTMEVDRVRGVVCYRLPHPSGVEVVYEEPIFPGVNDDSSLLAEIRRRTTL